MKKHSFLPLALCLGISTILPTYSMENEVSLTPESLETCRSQLSLLPSLEQLGHRLSLGSATEIDPLIEQSAGSQAEKNDVLFSATYKNDLQVVSTTLRAGADINARNYFLNETPLMIAAESGSKEMVQYLLDSGATIDLYDNFGQTALVRAAKEGHRSVVSLLLSKKTIVNSKDCQRALHAAAFRGHLPVVALLISKTAAQGIKDVCMPQTVELVSLEKDDEFTVVKFPLQLSLNPAVQLYLADPMKYLLEKCQTNNESSLYIGQIPLLMLACMFGHTCVVEQLRNYSISPEYLSIRHDYWKYMLCASFDALDYAIACGNDDTAAAYIEAFGDRTSWWPGELDKLLQRATKKKNQRLITALNYVKQNFLSK